jgi:tRNA pseudouridine13 synthase
MQPELIYPYGAAQVGARLKSIPEDFEVEEVLGFEPQGEGEHLFLWAEKRGLTTHELVERIARDHGLSAAPIGYSGLKDKHALTRQWLSLQLPGKADPFDCPSGAGYQVLQQVRHSKKLRPGSHKFNRFRLCLREVENLPQRTRQQMDSVLTQGFANYFGVQRFGRKADNVEQALAQLGKRRLSRARKSILLSSLRSHLFNAILAQRIGLDHWQAPLEGDVFMLRGSHSIFSEPADAALLERYRQLDLSPCGSLYGSGHRLMSGQAAAIEQCVFAAHPEITACLDKQRSNLQMRPLRAVVESFSYDYDAEEKLLRLEITLPAGSYVTTLMEHFLLLQQPD